jgi:hypothetical protein
LGEKGLIDDMAGWLEFNLHDRVAIRVAQQAPTAALMKEMFEPFLSDPLDHHDLTVTGKMVPVEGVSYGEHDYRYTEGSLYVEDMNVQILRDERGFHLNGTRELLTAALPLVDRIAVTNDAAMIHAATVDYAGHGVCMPAWGGVGKTSTVAKLVRLEGFAFMGDDWAFLSGDGQLLGYAKPMFIKPHHRPIYPHIFQEKRKPLIPSSLSKPVAQLTTIVHPLVTRYPRLAGITRKWSPEHMMVTPRHAFPDARISERARLAVVVFVERFDGREAVLETKDPSWMVSRLIGNFHSEMSLHSRELVNALGATGMAPIERHFAEKAEVLTKAIEGKPTFLLRVPVGFPADHASDVIVDHLKKALADSGIG